MHPYLDWLGIDPLLQSWLSPSLQVDRFGNLVFDHGGDKEVYGLGFHRVPTCGNYWTTVASAPTYTRQLVIAPSAMEAIAWIQFHASSLNNLDTIQLMATGTSLIPVNILQIAECARRTSVVLVNENSLLGAITDVKLAAAIRKMPINVSYQDERLHIRFRNKDYCVQAEQFSLNAFSRLSGFRFRCSTSKPANQLTWLQLLLADKSIKP